MDILFLRIKQYFVHFIEEAAMHCIEVKTNKYGRFTFDEMKSGKYFLQAMKITTNYYTQDAEVGSNSYGTGFSEKQRQYESKTHRLEKFVEVQKGGDVVDVALH